MKYLFSILFFLITQYSYAQKDAMKIMSQVRTNFLLVKDYTADAQIKIDVDFVKIPVKTAIVYFKQPDKFRFKAQGFAMIPKKGANMATLNLANGNYSAIYVNSEILNGILVDVIKVIPLDATSDIILSTVWVDNKYRIHKMESTTKNEGSYVMNFSFSNNPFNLPSQVVINFDVSKMDIPVGLTLDFDTIGKKKESKNTRGIVTVNYSNYKVNTGLSDTVFK